MPNEPWIELMQRAWSQVLEGDPSTLILGAGSFGFSVPEHSAQPGGGRAGGRDVAKGLEWAFDLDLNRFLWIAGGPTRCQWLRIRRTGPRQAVLRLNKRYLEHRRDGGRHQTEPDPKGPAGRPADCSHAVATLSSSDRFRGRRGESAVRCSTQRAEVQLRRAHADGYAARVEPRG